MEAARAAPDHTQERSAGPIRAFAASRRCGSVPMIPSPVAGTVVAVVLCACASAASTAAFAQRNAPMTGMNSGKQVQKIAPKTDRKSLHVAKATRAEPQSLRYLLAESP
ncbi:hypothetical protein A6456_27440 [Paraburkholderia tropica]|nr:hypothetical protein A6456_27440 [Paraburkholderia tropica]